MPRGMYSNSVAGTMSRSVGGFCDGENQRGFAPLWAQRVPPSAPERGERESGPRRGGGSCSGCGPTIRHGRTTSAPSDTAVDMTGGRRSPPASSWRRASRTTLPAARVRHRRTCGHSTPESWTLPATGGSRPAGCFASETARSRSRQSRRMCRRSTAEAKCAESRPGQTASAETAGPARCGASIAAG